MSAAEEFPGTLVPDKRKEPELYDYYRGVLALWALKYGPYLLDIERRHNETRGS